MNEKYTILWKPTPRSDSRSAGATGVSAVDNSQVPSRLSVDEFDEQTASELLRSGEILHLAPAMKTKLIKPLSATSSIAGHWGLDAIGVTASAYSGRGVRVAVLDTGIEASHPAFNGVNLIQKDFSSTGNGDRDGHGTHCAGVIFGRDINGLRIGVAPGVTEAFIGKVLRDDGLGDASMIHSGLRWAIDCGVQVISMSVGFDYAGEVDEQVAKGLPPALAASRALEAFWKNAKMFESIVSVARADRLSGADPLIVAAAGNESLRSEDPNFRFAVALPALVCDVSVGAASQASTLFSIAPFSNSNPDVVAPGVNIQSAWIGGGLNTKSGTSMACPHVAGVALLWAEVERQQSRRISGDILRSHILARARPDLLPGLESSDIGGGMVTAP